MPTFADPILSLVVIFLGLSLMVIVQILDNKKKEMQDWTYTDITPKILPEDQEEVEWVDLKSKTYKGHYEAVLNEFYAGPKQYSKVSQVVKWRYLD